MLDNQTEEISNCTLIVIGAGPAGLMAAEVVARAGYSVEIYDAMPSVGRKFLLAGVGGMNITHSESAEKFFSRYEDSQEFIEPILKKFGANELRDWAHDLGIETFVGSSGRVFPKDMKAAPLLRAWLHKLRELGVKIFSRHRWIGWDEDNNFLIESLVDGKIIQKSIKPAACVLALGGASWQRLGSNGAWVPWLSDKNISVSQLLPSNCGFEIQWSEKIRNQFAGDQLSSIGFATENRNGERISIRGEAVITRYGIEGTSVYALSQFLRYHIMKNGVADLYLDLLPDWSTEKIISALQKPQGKNSSSNFLRKQLNLTPIKLALLWECSTKEQIGNPHDLANILKNIHLKLIAMRPLDEAISTAGGVAFDELTEDLMLKKIPGVFCAGEMLDWEAPTGGYLLTACFATGVRAGEGVVNYLKC